MLLLNPFEGNLFPSIKDIKNSSDVDLYNTGKVAFSSLSPK